jgi:NodT family efflux transporter outer membrane factor (OMF) lipoprotein
MALAAPAEAKQFAATQSFAAPPASWPSDGWWLAYKDPQLSALISEGLANAPDLRVAAARFARAQALAGEAASAELPTLNGTGQIGTTKQTYNYIIPPAFVPKGWKVFGVSTLNLSWDLDFFGRTREAAAAAHLQAQEAEAEAADTRLTLSTGIAAAYATLQRQFAEQDAARDAAEVRRHTAALLEDRFRNGLENQGAVERAQADLATAQADLASLAEDIGLTRNQIAALTGAGPDRGLAITRPATVATVNFGLPPGLKLDLIGRRPDVIAAKLGAQAATRRIKVASAAFYPDVTISANLGLQALGLNNLIKAGSDYGTAGPAISLPLFDGGLLRGQYRQAEADYQIAVGQYDAALIQALRDVADVAVSEHALTARLEDSSRAEQHALQAWQTEQRRYAGKLATYLDVLTAEDALITARRTAATLRTRAFTLDISLIRALGGGFQS